MQDPKGSAMHHINTSQPQAARLWQVHCADTYRERSMGIACRHAQQAAQHSTAQAVSELVQAHQYDPKQLGALGLTG